METVIQDIWRDIKCSKAIIGFSRNITVVCYSDISKHGYNGMKITKHARKRASVKI